ncbi:unnamed protein product [Camellia sinensis]
MSSVISNFGAESSVASADNGFLGIGSVSGINRMVPTMAFKVSRRFEAYDLVQGAHVRWSYIMDKSVPDPPTAVLLHGILGSRKNWGTFARRLAQEFPTWQDRMSKKQIEISRRVGDLYMVESLHLPLSTSPRCTFIFSIRF